MTFATFGPPVHPGGILRGLVLPGAGLTPADAAARLGLPAGSLDAVLAEREPVSAELALRLGRLLGAGGAEHWMRMQMAYDLSTAAARLGDSLDRIAPVEVQPA